MFEVIVGNVGTVYRGRSHKAALRDFNHYKTLSDKGMGRASGEDVTLLKDGEVAKHHAGQLSFKI